MLLVPFTKLFSVLVIAALLMVTVTTIHSVSAVTKAAKPGWGYGDVHSLHTGPPGLSVRPVINQVNTTTLVASVTVNGSTGGNTVTNNDDPVSIVVGAVSHAVSFVFTTGSNIINNL
jgi:hypothetical protein